MSLPRSATSETVTRAARSSSPSDDRQDVRDGSLAWASDANVCEPRQAYRRGNTEGGAGSVGRSIYGAERAQTPLWIACASAAGCAAAPDWVAPRPQRESRATTGE